MRIRILLFLIGLLYLEHTKAQDHLEVATVNYQLFKGNLESAKVEKLSVFEDSVIYQYDTLSLPFIDDFSTNRLPEKVTGLDTNSKATFTRLYRLLQNGTVFLDSSTYTETPTFYYRVDSLGNVIDSIENPFIVFDVRTIDRFPQESEGAFAYPAYNIFDTIGNFGVDTVNVSGNLVQDSADYYVIDKDTNSFYVNRSVYVNNSQGFFPPSIGVATFDGLNEDGLPYNFDDIAVNGRADMLTSKPIDLSNVGDSLYFSFYYQAKGFALDPPDNGDSLVLEFYSDTASRWSFIWNVNGNTGSGDFNNQNTAASDSFRQVIVKVPDKFRTSAFQFRFRNYARLSGAFDPWHIDYIYLDDDRSINDTAQRDISIVYPPTPLLKDYYAMPVWHFRSNPGLYMTDNVSYLTRNNFNQSLNLYNKIEIPDTTDLTNPFYLFPGPDVFLPIRSGGTQAFNYPINFSYSPAVIDTFQVFRGVIDIRSSINPTIDKDFIPRNDTAYSTMNLNNFYAYDDGSAEAGYGVEAGTSGTEAFMAVGFTIPEEDTLGGLKIYFLPQAIDIRNQSFEITVWNNLSPSGIIFQKVIKDRAVYGQVNGYITYYLDSAVLVGRNFFVGIRQIGSRRMNIGYDLNTNNRSKIFYSLDGIEWKNPSANILDGSLMMQPIFRKQTYGVGVQKNKPSASDYKVYPNPATELLFITSDLHSNFQLQLFNAKGQELIGSYTSPLNISNLSNGLYFLRIKDVDDSNFITKKVMIYR